ncbi:MAG: DUF1367 family protein [Promethearchaeota archaeon]|jgi:hypothetical protein
MKLFAEIGFNNTIKPSFDSDYEQLKKVPKNTEVEVEIKQKRNIQFHRKSFALLNLCFENQDTFESFDAMRYYLTVKAGFFEMHPTPSGQPVILAKSISFSSMDDTEFSDWYSKVLDQVIKLTQADVDFVERELINFM